MSTIDWSAPCSEATAFWCEAIWSLRKFAISEVVSFTRSSSKYCISALTAYERLSVRRFASFSCSLETLFFFINYRQMGENLISSNFFEAIFLSASRLNHDFVLTFCEIWAFLISSSRPITDVLVLRSCGIACSSPLYSKSPSLNGIQLSGEQTVSPTTFISPENA